MPLTEGQREALEQLWAVTASESDAARDRDERLLRENGFDVQVSLALSSASTDALQRTVEQIFSMGSDPPAGPSRSSSTSHEQLEAMLPRAPIGARRLSGTTRNPGGVGLGLWGAITLPVRLVMGILSGTWYFLSEPPLPFSYLCP